MNTLKALCEPRPSVFDSSKRDTVLDLTDLADFIAGTADAKIKPAEFFEESEITEGIRILLSEGFRRLEGKSSQGVFKLTQAMGGGKTHSMLVFGLLGHEPSLRPSVMDEIYKPEGLERVRVISFSGRESDAPLGIWGAIAEQLGKREQFHDYYTPLQAPGQKAWINLLKGEPTLILLDELSPYFTAAKSKMIGNSDLAQVTAIALSNLLVAVGKGELSKVCLVISDLTGSYEEGSSQIASVLQDLTKETDRSAMSLEPVRINTDEFYKILRKRIFSKPPGAAEIASVAQEYANAVRDARQMDITNESPEKFAERIQSSYPFHPAIRDLYARFRENQGFQQTRAMIRLMRIVVSRLWDSGEAERKKLVSAHDLDFNDQETLSEINQINNTLGNAISHDVASGGGAVAEYLDTNLGTSDTRDTCRLLLISSLANVPNALIGMAIPELIANLCAPGRDVSRLKTDVLERLATAAWYLHSNRDGKLFFKNVENLNAKLESLAKSYIGEQPLKELRKRLEEIFEPTNRWCYQQVQALPAIDEIELSQDRVTLVIAAPSADSGGLSADLRTFFEQTTWRNRVAFLTGGRDTLQSLLENARRMKAISFLLEEMDAEKVPEKDPQRLQANELRDRIITQFHSAIRESFTTLYYPWNNELRDADIQMKFESNKFDGEAQVRELLKAKQKFTEEISGDTFRKKCEHRLFTTPTMLWTEVKKRAATQTNWQWHKADALDSLKEECHHKDYWRDEQGGFIKKGPFPKGQAEVRVQKTQRDDDTGRVVLRLNLVNADVVYAEVGGLATTASQKVETNPYETAELKVSFLAVDSTGDHPTGNPVAWQNEITLKHRFFQQSSDKMLELRAAPPSARIRYTTDGNDPRLAGGTYDDPVVVPRSARVVQAYAEKDGVESKVLELTIDWSDSGGVKVDPIKPTAWNRRDEVKTTQDTYKLLDRLAKVKAEAKVEQVTVQDEKDLWVQLTLADKIRLDAEKLKGIIEAMRTLVGGGQVDVTVGGLHFPTGQDLLDWVAESKTELQVGEVDQFTENPA
jgi:Protein of unknown function (DUF499)/Chitobiase/beta-hexosaminidase C-terminal domain